jgi:hypothetical protein
VFRALPSDRRLVMKDVVWCAGRGPTNLTFRYEILLQDGRGRQTAPVPTTFQCRVR